MILNFSVDVSKGLTISHMASHPSNARYPDATAITFDKSNFKVTVIYNDHSIYVWDVRDITKVLQFMFGTTRKHIPTKYVIIIEIL